MYNWWQFIEGQNGFYIYAIDNRIITGYITKQMLSKEFTITFYPSSGCSSNTIGDRKFISISGKFVTGEGFAYLILSGGLSCDLFSRVSETHLVHVNILLRGNIQTMSNKYINNKCIIWPLFQNLYPLFPNIVGTTRVIVQPLCNFRSPCSFTSNVLLHVYVVQRLTDRIIKHKADID